MLLGATLAAWPAGAAVEGTVWNGTTGREQGGVPVTLVKLGQGGMTPAGTTKSDTGGKFRFEQDAAGPGGQPMPILLRGEFDGVTYNQMIPPGTRTGDVRLTVYKSAPVNVQSKAGMPAQRILFLEPSGQEMAINEFFIYQNQSQPPVTYADAKQGTLRFYLPAASKGAVQVSATGPGGMPLHETAEKTGQPEVYKVNFAIKPGETRIELTYAVPYQSPMDFDVRSLYDGLTTRVAAPSGVTLAGDGLQPMAPNPQIQASIFAVPEAKLVKLSITGEGKLSQGDQQGDDQGGENISVIPAAIHNQLWLVLGFAFGILGLGFWALYAASGRTAGEAKGAAAAVATAAAAAPKRARARGKRKA